MSECAYIGVCVVCVCVCVGGGGEYHTLYPVLDLPGLNSSSFLVSLRQLTPSIRTDDSHRCCL